MYKELQKQPITKEEIQSEIDEALRTGETLGDYFNNLVLHLPGSAYRKMFEEVGMMDVEPASIYANTTNAYSDLKRSQTLRKFYENFDEACREEGIDVHATAEAYSTRKANRTEIVTSLLPAYFNLRMRGYNHYPDLTA